MPLLRAEQLRELTLKDNRIANDANIKQHKIENWQSDPAGWISKGIIKPVTTANLPQWDGTQAGQMYYDINTNELFIGITTAPYYQLIAGAGIGDSAFSDRILVVKMAFDAENWSGATDDDVNGTASIFALDTDKVSTDGSNLLVYLNGVLQERGSGNDYVLYSENDIDKIQFTYNIEGPEQKVTAIINNDARLVNYATKSYVDDKFYGQSAHDHDGIDSNQLDINASIKASSLAALINSIVPSTPAVNLGSPTNKFGKIYAEEGHFDANTIYLGGVALSGTGDTLMVSKDGGSSFVEVPVSGSSTEPAKLSAGENQQVILESTSGIVAKGDIIPDVTNTRNIGSTTNKFNKIYAEEVFVGASSLYVNGKKVIEDVSDQINFRTDTDQGMVIKTTASTPGVGNANITIDSGNELNVVAAGGSEFVVPNSSSKHINFTNNSINGNITFETTSTGGEIQFTSLKEISFDAPTVSATTFTGSLSGNASTASKLMVPRTISFTGDTSGSVVFDGSSNIAIDVSVVNDSHTHTSSTISDASSTNTPNVLVKRDASGDFSANIITANLVGNVSGNATTATKLASSRSIALSGDATGSAAFNGSNDIDITVSVADNSHNHTSANISDATSSNIANMVVKRDASGNFSAGAITAASISISGNLIVNGTTTTVNTTELTISDNVIVLNKNQTGTPQSLLTSGIEIERGDSINYQFMFRESDDAFVIGASDSLQAVATRQDAPVANAIPFWNATANRLDSSGVTVSGSTITGSLSGNASTASAVAWTGITGGPKTGSSTFAGSSVAKTIAHGLGRTPTFVGITPSANPSGYLGEVWYTADATNINVYNSGSAVTAFTWFAV